jgi:hypothetical protein
MKTGYLEFCLALVLHVQKSHLEREEARAFFIRTNKEESSKLSMIEVSFLDYSLQKLLIYLFF